MSIVWISGPRSDDVWHVGLTITESDTSSYDHHAVAEVWSPVTQRIATIPLPDYDSASRQFSHGYATADLLPQYREAVAAFRVFHANYNATMANRRSADVIGSGKKVRLKGTTEKERGVVWVCDTDSYSTPHGERVDIRRPDTGETKARTMRRNCEVIDAGNYVYGCVTCGGCRCTFDSWNESGMEFRLVSDFLHSVQVTILCRPCYEDCVLKGQARINLSSTDWGFVPVVGRGEASDFVRNLLENEDDEFSYLVYADWLQDNDFVEYAEKLRVWVRTSFHAPGRKRRNRTKT